MSQGEMSHLIFLTKNKIREKCRREKCCRGEMSPGRNVFQPISFYFSVYVEAARTTSSTTLAFTLATTTTGATFNIKVTQIECSSVMR